MKLFSRSKKGKRAKKCVLVVDDEMFPRETMCHVLTECGFHALGADCCAEALRVMEKESPHLVLLDIQLPDEDGLTFLGQLKRKFPQVPVIMLTGLGYDESLMKTALQNGASGYVGKDAGRGSVMVAIDEALRKSRAAETGEEQEKKWKGTSGNSVFLCLSF